MLVSLPYSPVNSLRAGPSAWHLKVLLINIWMNKLRPNPVRFKGFSPLFLKPQEGAILGTGWCQDGEKEWRRQSLVCLIFSVRSRGKVYSDRKVSSSHLESELISCWKANKKQKIIKQDYIFSLYMLGN